MTISSRQPKSSSNPYADFPELSLPKDNCMILPAPDDRTCFALWEKYAMPANIKRHSLKVAKIATMLAKRAKSLGFRVCPKQVRASALLHDLAKVYSLRYGGSHAQLGGAWVLAETKNQEIAQGVLLHVYWPWPIPEGPQICSLPFFIIYADKRVRHDLIVSLDERFTDILARYGHDEKAVEGIGLAREQALTIERALSAQLGWKLDEDSFNSGRMVHRT